MRQNGLFVRKSAHGDLQWDLILSPVVRRLSASLNFEQYDFGPAWKLRTCLPDDLPAQDPMFVLHFGKFTSPLCEKVDRAWGLLTEIFQIRKLIYEQPAGLFADAPV